jgi:hypothetical protein
MTIDYGEVKRQCIKGFKKERGTKIGDLIWRMGNRHYIMLDGIYVYALFDVGRKTRKEDAIKNLTESNEALNEIIKIAKELQAEIAIELKKIG